MEIFPPRVLNVTEGLRFCKDFLFVIWSHSNAFSAFVSRKWAIKDGELSSVVSINFSRFLLSEAADMLSKLPECKLFLSATSFFRNFRSCWFGAQRSAVSKLQVNLFLRIVACSLEVLCSSFFISASRFPWISNEWWKLWSNRGRKSI